MSPTFPGSKQSKKSASNMQQAETTQRTTRRYIPEDKSLHDYRCENLKAYIDWKLIMVCEKANIWKEAI
jgi:hypothetical protein